MSDPEQTTPDTSVLDDADYISLSTVRADGSAVATPVWLRGSDGVYDVMTAADSHKVRRLQANPTVEVAPCDVRGNVAPGAARFRGTAELITDPPIVERTVAAIRGQYPIMGRMIPLLSKVRSLLPGGTTPDYLIVKITVTEALDRS
ncbi:PPOX class F420-dependent oxidoreductase [Euzebya tangerina]|uniref:PPOX class F420-dependent oxidoreductase n=1 Tax=Euzebya tangerina TaxID=591198 RepID=UPI000E31FBBC|nr:PPOX class F420-dependent oxidoreductase [Euzebya tangerina]